MLQVCGINGRGEPYDGEVMVLRSDGALDLDRDRVLVGDADRDEQRRRRPAGPGAGGLPGLISG